MIALSSFALEVIAIAREIIAIDMIAFHFFSVAVAFHCDGDDSVASTVCNAIQNEK